VTLLALGAWKASLQDNFLRDARLEHPYGIAGLRRGDSDHFSEVATGVSPTS